MDLEKLVAGFKGLGTNRKRSLAVYALAAAVVMAGISIKSADAGVISISNSTDSELVTHSLYLENCPEGTEGYDPYDFPFTPTPADTYLTVYTKADGYNLSFDTRGFDTSGRDFYLAVTGSVDDIDNYLQYSVDDLTDLQGKQLVMWDYASPDVKYTLNTDAASHNIPLPNLTASDQEYAKWRVDIIPEPSTFALLGLSAVALNRRITKRRG